MFCSSCGTAVLEAASFCQKCGASAGTANSTVSSKGFSAPSAPSADSDKLMAIFAHLGGILFGFIPSLIVFLIKKDSPGWGLDNAREALNWQITVFIAALVCGVLMFVLIGVFLLWVLMLTNLVLCIVAAVKVSSKQAYHYPFCLRLLN